MFLYLLALKGEFGPHEVPLLDEVLLAHHEAVVHAAAGQVHWGVPVLLPLFFQNGEIPIEELLLDGDSDKLESNQELGSEFVEFALGAGLVELVGGFEDAGIVE